MGTADSDLCGVEAVEDRACGSEARAGKPGIQCLSRDLERFSPGVHAGTWPGVVRSNYEIRLYDPGCVLNYVTQNGRYGASMRQECALEKSLDNECQLIPPSKHQSDIRACEGEFQHLSDCRIMNRGPYDHGNKWTSLDPTTNRRSDGDTIAVMRLDDYRPDEL